MNDELKEKVRAINELAMIPMKTEAEMKMVEIIVLKFKTPEVETDCAAKIIQYTNWPFKLTVYDNRLNTANTSKIWNKLIKESTCDYVCIIDSDAFVADTSPCWLTRLMESIDETGIVVPVGDNVGGINKALVAEKYPSAKVAEGAWSGYCFLIKKSKLAEVGDFDEQFYIYGQDSEWAVRAGKAVIRLDTFVKHLGSYSFKKADKDGEIDRETDKVRSAMLFKMKTCK